MMKFILCAVFAVQFSYSQEINSIQTYANGHNGMELVSRTKDKTIIISTFNAKLEIRENIARLLHGLYMENKLISNSMLSIIGEQAAVTGKCIITVKESLVTVDFYYEKVYWNDGLIEIFNGIGDAFTAVKD